MLHLAETLRNSGELDWALFGLNGIAKTEKTSPQGSGSQVLTVLYYTYYIYCTYIYTGQL